MLTRDRLARLLKTQCHIEDAMAEIPPDEHATLALLVRAFHNVDMLVDQVTTTIIEEAQETEVSDG